VLLAAGSIIFVHTGDAHGANGRSQPPPGGRCKDDCRHPILLAGDRSRERRLERAADGRLLTDAGENDWIIRFVTDGRSRKALDLRHTAEVGLIFQHADDAFVALIGKAILIENASEVRQLWKEAYSAYFPTERDRANAAFVQVDVDRMELWVRGLTPEPFGLHPTTLERGADGVWRLTSGDRKAA
jgi:general stress protein 26